MQKEALFCRCWLSWKFFIRTAVNNQVLFQALVCSIIFCDFLALGENQSSILSTYASDIVQWGAIGTAARISVGEGGLRMGNGHAIISIAVDHISYYFVLYVP